MSKRDHFQLEGEEVVILCKCAFKAARSVSTSKCKAEAAFWSCASLGGKLPSAALKVEGSMPKSCAAARISGTQGTETVDVGRGAEEVSALLSSLGEKVGVDCTLGRLAGVAHATNKVLKHKHKKRCIFLCTLLS